MKTLNDSEVRIVKLDPLRVLRSHGFGPSPEGIAWQKLQDYASRHQLADWTRRRFFGFNNPDPSPGSPNYGYEQWMTIDADTAVEQPLTRKHVPARRYAVTRFKGIENITDTWRRFVAWFEESGLRPGPGWNECLEELLTPITQPPEDWEFDLYLPLAEGSEI